MLVLFAVLGSACAFFEVLGFLMQIDGVEKSVSVPIGVIGTALAILFIGMAFSRNNVIRQEQVSAYNSALALGYSVYFDGTKVDGYKINYTKSTCTDYAVKIDKANKSVLMTKARKK